MHEYTCKDCDESSFYVKFAPMFDPPAFCPCCGSHEYVSYVGEYEGSHTIIVPDETHNQQIDAITDLMRKLDDIKKGKLKYGLSDLSDWLENDLDKVAVLLDELRYEVENE